MPRAVWNGAVIAESADTIVVDGRHYFSRDAVHDKYLRDSDTQSTCGWKGIANYFHLEVDGAVNRDAAWYYPAPKTAAEAIAGRIGFWRGVKIENDDAEPNRTFLPRFRRRRTPITTRTANERPGGVAPTAIADVDDSSFEAATSGGWTVVDFWAPWCGPCRTFHPLFEAFADAHAGEPLRFLRCDVDASPATAAAVGIFTIPSVVLFDPSGSEVARLTGVPSARSLEELLKPAATANHDANGDR